MNENFWDPTRIVPSEEKISNGTIQIESKFEKIKKNNAYKNILYIFYGISLLLFIFGIIFLLFPIIFFSLIILGISYSVHKAYLKKIAVDIIKYEIAKENNYLYYPLNDYNMYYSYLNQFPEVFNKGDEDKKFEDIFWGKSGENSFVSGLFYYTNVSRDSKGRKHSTVYSNNFFVIKLPKILKSRFYLHPENVFSKVGNFFTNKEINTESIEFNKTFAFSYNGKKDEHALEIVKTLSPRVQEELINLSKKKKGLEVLFSNDCVIFLSRGILISKMKTNFSKSFEINTEDKTVIKEKLDEMIDISNEIIKYLD